MKVDVWVISLSQTELFQRCVLGTTENQNGSLNALAWARYPKHKQHGCEAVRCPVAAAIFHFHNGAKSRLGVMKRLSIHAGGKTKQVCDARMCSE
jgi:hypothetical protein